MRRAKPDDMSGAGALEGASTGAKSWDQAMSGKPSDQSLEANPEKRGRCEGNKGTPLPAEFWDQKGASAAMRKQSSVRVGRMEAACRMCHAPGGGGGLQ